VRARLLLPIGLVASAVAWGCGGEDEGSAGGGPLVVATTAHVADFARNVAGERAQVEQLLTPGADPHDYEPRPSDVREVSRASLIVRSGGDLDDWLGDLVEDAGSGARVLELLDRIPAVDRDDPHWWQDPRNTIRAVAAIRRTLVSVDPEGREIYSRNAAGYARRLRHLDREIARCMEMVPDSRRKVVTTHDSLGYFAARYDVEVVGALIPSLSTQAQPSARDVERLVDQIRDEGVEAIFPESALDPKLERAVAREADAEIGGTLWADSLGPSGSDGATYVEAMASNTAAMVRGMTGGEESCRPRLER
jgi:zinc/manganese transport system substrate-binding protein